MNQVICHICQTVARDLQCTNRYCPNYGKTVIMPAPAAAPSTKPSVISPKLVDAAAQAEVMEADKSHADAIYRLFVGDGNMSDLESEIRLYRIASVHAATQKLEERVRELETALEELVHWHTINPHFTQEAMIAFPKILSNARHALKPKE